MFAGREAIGEDSRIVRGEWEQGIFASDCILDEGSIDWNDEVGFVCLLVDWKDGDWGDRLTIVGACSALLEVCCC